MFTAFITKFKAAPEDVETLNKANEALRERMDHMLRVTTIATRIVSLEAKPAALVKNPISIRKAIAA